MKRSDFCGIMLLVAMLLIGANYVFAEDALFIDSTGNVGIGIDSPTKKLEVDGDIVLPNSTGDKQIYTYSSTARAWRIGMSRSPGFTRSMATSWVQYITYYDAPGRGFAVGVNDGLSSFEITGSNHNAFFRGNVGIGTSSPDAKLNVQSGSDVELSGGGFIVAGDLSGKNVGIDNNEIMARNNGSTSTLYVQNNGGNTLFGGKVGINQSSPLYNLDIYGVLRVNNTLYYSDERMKKNIKNIDSSLKQLSRVRGVSYEWNDEKIGKKKHFGVLASEIEEVFPELVYTDEEGIKSVDYVGMIAPMIEAMKELKAENDYLIEQNNTLEDRMSEIEDALEAIVSKQGGKKR